MSEVFGLMADVHLHEWSAFSSTTSEGVNVRLENLLQEIIRCSKEVRRQGGKKIVIAGDLFHVRGSVAPVVLNLALATFQEIANLDMEVHILAGNHDLTGKKAEELGSAISALRAVGCFVYNKTTVLPRFVEGTDLVLIPWVENINDLKDAIRKVAKSLSAHSMTKTDLILHAPIDGVIAGLPEHGLTAKWLSDPSFRFRRVFSGHYHNHKCFEETGVYSIGALAHHTWSDAGSKAGFLTVSPTEVNWHKSHAPDFVEITEDTDPDDIPMIVDGNFIKAKINSFKSQDVEELRQHFASLGAKGSIIIQQKDTSVAKREGGSSIKAGASIGVSVEDFIKAKGFEDAKELTALCQQILLDAVSLKDA